MIAGSPRLFIGIGIVVSAIVLVLLGPLVMGTSTTSLDVTNAFAPPFTSGHLLGTDDLGRDVLIRVLVGGRTSLLIALAAVALAAVMGSLIGLCSGVAGGVFDLLFMRITDILFAIPGLLIAIAIVAILGKSPTTTVFAIGIAYTPLYARITRGAVVGVRDLGFVEATRVIGSGSVRTTRKEIVPAISPMLLAHTTAIIGFAILDEAGLGFLGLGVQPPTPSWGSLLVTSREMIYQAPYIGVATGALVVITVIGFNLIGDGLGHALDPRGVRR
jgi:peptide/nickel transport system permease protein